MEDMAQVDAKRVKYEGWVDQWSTDLYRFAYRLCGQRDTAEDLVQEAFYHAWRSMHTLREECRARAWLFQILRHRYAHHVRYDVRRPNLRTSADVSADLADEDRVDPLGAMERSESLAIALERLDERYREPLLMVFMEGLTCKEASEAMGVPLGTVLSRIHRARKSLREQLGEWFGAGGEERESEEGEEAGQEGVVKRLRFGA